jgi:hypothetical protein
MQEPIQPKAENKGIGFYYTVTDEQIERHRQLTIPEIFEWLESTRLLIESVQTDEAKEFAKKLKNKKTWL